MRYLIVVGFLFFLACKSNQTEQAGTLLFSEVPGEVTGIAFQNTVNNTEDFNIFNYRNFYNGGGVAIGDLDNDGWSDIVFTSNMGANKVYRNKGNWEFEDISKKAGVELQEKWTTGVVLVDINSDDLLDIYLCNAGYRENSNQKNALFINQGDLSFINEAEKYGLDEEGYTTHAAFFDYDRDGDLDVYLLNNSFIPVNTLNYSNKRTLRAKDWPVRDFLKGGGDKLLRNDQGTFVDVSEEAGIFGSLIGFGLGVTIGDVNNDTYPDIYVSNDFFERDYLYINQKDGTFSEELEQRISHLSHSSMGADMADINNDGALEIFVTDMLPKEEYRLKTTTTFDNIDLHTLKLNRGFYYQFMHNTLQLNNGQGSFSEISHFSDVAASDWSWGALMFDANNDLFTDLFVCNGIYHDVIDQDFIDFFANEIIQKMAISGEKEALDSVINRMPSVPIPNKLFMNTGKYRFEDKSSESGLSKETFSNGAAYGDLDNDGDLDLVINNVNQEALVYRNNSDNNYLGISIKYKAPNNFGIGSRISLFLEGNVLVRELIPSRGFQSSVDYKMIFGLGNKSDIDSLIVTWPDGTYSKYNDLVVNQHHVIQHDLSKVFNKNKEKVSGKLFTKLNHDFDSHEEDAYNDFYYERNIPVQLSKEGPKAALTDLNDDGKLDIFIGGAAGQSAQIYMSNSRGYSKVQESLFEKFKAFEDTCAEFFDADQDGDMDLIVGSGGNNASYGKRAYRDRLYINNDGVFELDFMAIPPNTFNTSVIKPHDFDQDGDLDLFVGSRSVPGNYGMSPGSFIYVNNGKGEFRDLTQIIIPELALAGMVTDAAWGDVLPQEGDELVLVGEWMSPKILSYQENQFKIIDTDLLKYSGWYQSLEILDVNEDGNQDIVLGNMGENFYLKADSLRPLRMWINDFNSNGFFEKIITRSIDGKDMPVVMKRDLTDQLPGLKKQNLMHSSYATKAIHELIEPDVLRSSTVKQINFLQSAVAISDGNGGFSIKALPQEVQLSCINEIVQKDVNQDNREDLIIGGNNHYFLPQFSRLDACRGKVLINDGKGDFEIMPENTTGLKLEGVVRGMYFINDDQLLILQNGLEPSLYQLSTEN